MIQESSLPGRSLLQRIVGKGKKSPARTNAFQQVSPGETEASGLFLFIRSSQFAEIATGHIQLSDLLLQGHSGQQILHPFGYRKRRIAVGHHRPVGRDPPLFTHITCNTGYMVDPDPVCRIGGVTADGIDGRQQRGLEPAFVCFMTRQDQPAALLAGLADQRFDLAEAFTVQFHAGELCQIAPERIIGTFVQPGPPRFEHGRNQGDITAGLLPASHIGLSAGIPERERGDPEHLFNEAAGRIEFLTHLHEGILLEGPSPGPWKIARAGMDKGVVPDIMALFDRSLPAFGTLDHQAGGHIKGGPHSMGIQKRDPFVDLAQPRIVKSEGEGHLLSFRPTEFGACLLL